MKKNLLYLAIVAFMAFTACTSKTTTELSTNDCALHKLKENVASVKYSNYNANVQDGRIVEGTEEAYAENTVFKFNEKGQVIEELDILSDGTFVEKIVSQYNENDKLSNVKIYSANDILLLNRVYTWDGGFISLIESYNADGTLIDKIEQKNNGEFITEKTKYSQNSNIDYVEVITSEGENKYKIVSYNADGQVTSTMHLEKECDLLNEMKADDYSMTVNRNANGEEIEIKNGRMEGPNLNMAKGQHMFYEYEYDSKGNWIKRVEFDAEKNPIVITEREIAYR